MVAAARKHNRRLQMGNQRRSWSGIRQAIDELHGGVIGRPYRAQAFYAANSPVNRPRQGSGRVASSELGSLAGACVTKTLSRQLRAL